VFKQPCKYFIIFIKNLIGVGIVKNCLAYTRKLANKLINNNQQ